MPRYLHNERFFAEHRAEDMALIAEVVRAHRPRLMVELGTLAGGFAAFLADLATAWGGTVHTFDVTDEHLDRGILAAYPNLHFHREDALTDNPGLAGLVSLPGALLYTDNGDKEREIATYAPRLAVGSLLGTHDYDSQVRPVWAEPFLRGLGFEQHRHPDFEALASPPHYPISMTRFWRRVRIP